MSNRIIPVVDFPLRHDNFVRSIGDVRYFAATRTTVAIANANDSKLSQMVQITFSKGGVFVQFPYFEDTFGLVGNVTPEYSTNHDSTLAIAEQGIVTPSLVKYSHPPDGHAHFSQTGKVLTKIRRQSFPLSKEGQLFEFTAILPRAFKYVSKNSAKKNRLYVPFVFRNGIPETVKVTGAWWSVERLLHMQREVGCEVGPLEHFENFSTKTRFPGFILGPTTPDPTHVLVVSAGAAVTPQGTDDPHLIFFGGFDEGIEVIAPPKGLLVCWYPLTDPEQWIEALGTIEYRK